MDRTPGQKTALDMLRKSEASETRADIGAALGVGESSVYFQIRFGRFLRYRDAHPDDRQDLGAWHHFDKVWAKTDKKATVDARFAELIAALPPAADVPAKAPRKNAKGKPAPVGADWPPATEVAAKATTEPAHKATPAAEGIAAAIADVAPDATAAALQALTGVDESAPDPIATKRAAKTLAQRLRRAAAKAAVQWRGESELTAGQ